MWNDQSESDHYAGYEENRPDDEAAYAQMGPYYESEPDEGGVLMNNLEKRWIWILAAFIVFIGVSLSLFMATILDAILAQTFSIPFINSLSVSMCIQNVFVNLKIRIFFGAFSVIALGSAFFVSTSRFGRFRAELVQITPRIAIPVPAGEGQYGTAWFADIPAPIPYRKGDSKAYFNTHVINKIDPLFTWLLEEGKQDCEMVNNGEIIDFTKVDVYPGETAPFSETVTGKKSTGFVVGMEVKRFAGIEYIYSVDHNSHAICFGATRCGKSRCVVLPTICLVALGGDSMFITDLKRELIDYTRPYLLRLGYSVYELNFKRPECSNRYNFLEGIIEAVRQGDLPGAVEKTWDMAAILCEKGGETQDILWRNGEGAVIAMCIFIVVCNNQNHYEYQKLINVYYFMA
ncbi:type IV secretory system conjugative DNA transfer family protein [Eubacterium aggregans]|uniref:type IV secretory system conjugative DNA transfer family protein n=2 Tax=Eubacterium aggregans TaxID=81409 RepID=UPI003F3BB519